MHHESRNDSASILRFSECIAILSRVDSEFSFEQQMALHASETCCRVIITFIIIVFFILFYRTTVKLQY